MYYVQMLHATLELSALLFYTKIAKLGIEELDKTVPISHCQRPIAKHDQNRTSADLWRSPRCDRNRSKGHRLRFLINFK
jgi:hypothetical protein